MAASANGTAAATAAAKMGAPPGIDIGVAEASPTASSVASSICAVDGLGDTLASLASATAATGSSAATPLRGATGVGSVHADIDKDIGQQVQMMILNARRSSETKVAAEIQKVKAKMEAMNAKIKTIAERVNRIDPSKGALLKVDLQKDIAKLEEVWEGEVGTLKHELWQTIQAHNHNADLMKQHKDAIDQIQSRMSTNTPNQELEHIHSQLLQVDRVVQKEQAKQQQIDQLAQRLDIVRLQLIAGLGGWSGAGLPFPVPGALPSPMPGATLPTSAAGKKASKKVPKAAKTTKATNSGLPPQLRAEAPEFVPTFG
jgi:uncharacterized protein YukE